MPMLDASTAATGIPRLLSFPNRAGAKPLRESEKSIRAVKYKLHNALESAADSTTKFITWLAAGIPTRSNTRTNGLCPSPISVHGTMPTTSASPPR